MAEETFEFDLPGGKKIRTGMQTPDTMPLSFISNPPQKKHDLNYIKERSENSNKICIADPVSGAPERMEWFNQGGRSSCNLYMISWMLCTLMWRQTGRWKRLSPEHLYTLINGGRDGGSMLDDGMVVCHDEGMCAYTDRLYEVYQAGKIKDNMELVRHIEQTKGDHTFQECYKADSSSFETLVMDLLSTLADGGVCGTAVHVGNRYMKSGEKAGLDKGPGNHAVAVVDYRLLTPNPQSIEDFEFLSPQSWGGNFGKDGFTWLSPKHFYEPGRVHAYYCVTAASTTSKAQKSCRIA